MTAVDELAVIIPARDEEPLIGRSLAAVGRARREVHRQLGHDAPGMTTIVVADGCLDATATVAKRFPGVRVIETAPVGVGAARAVGAREALARASADLQHVWLANTDADSVVHPRWLLEQIEAATLGADVYLGDVRPDFADLSPEQQSAWLATHPAGVPRGHTHGASLGIRASAYSLLGGFETLTTGEDVDLVERARAARLTVRTSPTEVLTSGRRQGRAPDGYARYLAVDLLSLARELRG